MDKIYGESPVMTSMKSIKMTYTVEYFTNNRWRPYSGPHNNIDSAVCNASVVSGCRHTNARIKNGQEIEEGNAEHWEKKLKEKAS